MKDSNFLDFMRSNKIIIIEKSHYAHENILSHNNNTDNVYKIIDNCDCQSLLASSDILITDYSGAFFDYLILNRPIVHFLYDYEEYKNNTRGLYFDKENVVAGPVANNLLEVKNAIRELILEDDSYHSLRKDIKEKFMTYESIDTNKKILILLKIRLWTLLHTKQYVNMHLKNMSRINTILITEGNSGDKVSLENNMGALKIIKTMKGDLERIKNSINKQQDFQSLGSNGILLNSIPLESVSFNKDSIEIKMPYILGETGASIQFNSSTTCSINLKFALDKYFEKLLESSKKTLVDTKIFIQKFNTVLKNVDDRQIFEAIKKFEKFFYTKEEKIEVLVGPCHGDLTLSNLLSVGDRVFYLFDFLIHFLKALYRM